MQKLFCSGVAYNLMLRPEPDWFNTAKSGFKLYAPLLQKMFFSIDSSIIWSDSADFSGPAPNIKSNYNCNERKVQIY